MGNSAPKLPQSNQPNPSTPLLQVFEYFRSNPGKRADLKQVVQAVNTRFSEEHSEKVIRVALAHLMESNYISFHTEDKNRYVYFAVNEGHWDGTTTDEFEIYAMHVIQNFGMSICDYGNATASITNQTLRLKSREQNEFAKMVVDHAGISVPFFQAPDNKGRAIIVDAIKNFGKLVTVETIDGHKVEVRIGGVCLRRGNIYISLVDGNRVFGLYFNEINSLQAKENSLRLEFSHSVKTDISNMVSSAFDGPQLSEGSKIVLEVHPDAAQALLWGRPQSDLAEIDELTEDGWIRFTQHDNIRQELVDLLAGMAGRARVVGPVELKEMVSERIREIAALAS